MSAEGGSPPLMPMNNEPENMGPDNAKVGNIWVNLNDSSNNKQSEMMETIKSLKAELLSVKTDNERILKAQEELNEVLLNKILGQDPDKVNKQNRDTAGTASFKKKARKLNFSDNDSDNQTESNDHKIEHSSEDSHNSHHKNKKKRQYHDEITGEFKKIKPPTFNGEVETGEEAEAWLSGMKKYFQIYNYSGELKARMAIYNLTGKADIWWQDLKRMKRIKEKGVTWSSFKKYFKKQYLSEQYYEGKAKEFYELKLGNLSMKDLCSKFLSLLRYVPYIAEEKPKVQRFLSCLPNIYKDRIEYDDPKTLEEAMRKAKICYDQNKNRAEHTSSWKGKKTENFNQGKRNNRFSNN